MPISLFYHYTDIADVESLASYLKELGPRLELAGRIRVSSEGINGTFGGIREQVNEFHNILLQRLNHPQIDFKVSEGSAVNFPGGWKVRVCKELVTMGISPETASWRDAAPHLDPVEFRTEVLDFMQAANKDVVVLDVRNQYEHAIGRFKGAVLPQIRQFSDFPDFLRENASTFRNKRVLMYCTGGIRCERASAFLQKQDIARSVVQLRGGIDRFLSAYPCGGGVFEGKNLVFDTRLALGTTNRTVVGVCLCCGCPWDDYTSNMRCSYCRSRVLICERESCEVRFQNNNMGLCSECRNQVPSNRTC